MATKRTTASAQPQQTVFPAEYSSQPQSDNSEPKYVIQRSSETVREWWTGSGWSDDFNHALQYPNKPDASVETMDEMAKALTLDEIDD